jgi:signal transduction histidine kinase
MLLIASLAASILSELFFTLYSDVYGLFNQLGHFFVILSSFLIYKSIIETGLSHPFNLLFSKIESISRFPAENPDPVMRINDKNLIIYSNNPAKMLLSHLNNEEKSKFLKLLRDPASGSIKNTKLKTVEIKINKFTYEFTVLPIKDFDYFNVYGRDITTRKKAERFKNIIAKEKTLNEERNKLARELHDTVTQTLFSANLIAEVIPKLWKKNPKAAIKNLEEVKMLNNVALMEMRSLLYELRPSVLKDEILGDLLGNLAKSFEAKSKISLELKIDGEYKFSPKIELGFFRIAQEALNNIIKHSQATKASIILKVLPEKLYMDIADNGRGFNDKKIASTNLGLAIMRERAKNIKASIAIESLPGKGTKITVIYVKNIPGRTIP